MALILNKRRLAVFLSSRAYKNLLLKMRKNQTPGQAASAILAIVLDWEYREHRTSLAAGIQGKIPEVK